MLSANQPLVRSGTGARQCAHLTRARSGAALAPSLKPTSRWSRSTIHRGPADAWTDADTLAAKAVAGDRAQLDETAATRRRGMRPLTDFSKRPSSLQVQFAKVLQEVMPWFDPNQEEQLAAKAALEKVTLVLERSPSLQVTCVRPVGSWARQTAVTQGFDIDVVAFVRRFEGTDVTSLEMWRGDKLTRMRRHVKDQLQAADPSWKVEVRNDAHYQHVLHVTVGEVEVDLLLAPDCTAGGKVGKMWASTQHKRLRKPLLSNPAATVFDLVRHRSDSAALIEFYIGALADVLEVMRFVKGLYKYGVQVAPGCEHIRSLSLEVLVLAAHQRLRSTKYRRNPKAYKMELLVEFLRLVVAAVEKREVVMLDVSYWCRAVQPYGYSREVGMQYVHIWGNDPMIVIHPTDFTCNLERPPEGRAASDWSGLVQLAERLLARLERNDVVGFWAEPEVVRAMVHAVRLRRAIVEGDGHHRRLRQYLGGAAPVKRARKQSRVLRAVR